eukprot:gene5519-biopygen5455
MFGLAGEPSGIVGNGVASTSTSSVLGSISSLPTPSAETTGPAPSTPCMWWMLPWHSSTLSSGNPAAWNCPSTLEVHAKYSPPNLPSPHRFSTAKPSFGTVFR